MVLREGLIFSVEVEGLWIDLFLSELGFVISLLRSDNSWFGGGKDDTFLFVFSFSGDLYYVYVGVLREDPILA